MTTLFVDVGMTLLGGPKESPSTFICNLLGIPLENKKVVSDVVFCKDVGSVNELVGFLGTELNLTVKSEQKQAVQRFWDSQIMECQPLEGAIEFCDKIIAAGIKYYIVSNLWHPFYEALELHLKDFIDNAKGSFLSYKMGSCKPSDDFYSQVYSSVPALPKDIIMFGDSMRNDMQPCIKRGSTGILFSVGDNPRACPHTRLENLIRVQSYDECLVIVRKIIEGKCYE